MFSQLLGTWVRPFCCPELLDMYIHNWTLLPWFYYWCHSCEKRYQAITTFMIAMFGYVSLGKRLTCNYTIGTNEVETLSTRSFSDYVIHFRMAKEHKCPLAAVCMGVHEEKWREVAFDSLRPQTFGDCREKLSNNRNSRQKLRVGVVELSSLLV